jgi:hypothetical protein
MSLEKYCINTMITRVMSSKQAAKSLGAVPGVYITPKLWTGGRKSHRVTAALIDTSGDDDSLFQPGKTAIPIFVSKTAHPSHLLFLEGRIKIQLLHIYGVNYDALSFVGQTAHTTAVKLDLNANESSLFGVSCTGVEWWWTDMREWQK